ncbi:MAG TPA: hypothetical protein VHB79_08005 [Polyangiaceae bacterium]|nr:hypothetical protein [Polyangiaceae bacterium]
MPWRCGALLASIAVALPGCTSLLDLDHDYRLKDAQVGGTEAGGSDAGRTSGGGGATAGDGAQPGGGKGTTPQLPSGKLAFHSYTSYDASDSRMYVVEMPGGSLEPELGEAFGVCTPRAGSFSPDGTKLVVAAQPKVGGVCPAYSREALEIFILDLTTLTSGTRDVLQVTANNLADEDPQFAPHSDFLLFKHNNHIVKWTLGSPAFTVCGAQTSGSFCFKSMGNEEIKPVISDDEGIICYQAGPVPEADILCFDRIKAEAGAEVRSASFAVATKAIAETRASMSKAWLYYTHWRTLENGVDIIVRKSANDLMGVEQEAAFPSSGVIDYSDPYPIEGDLLVFSSDVSGAGKHDLFVGTFGDISLFSLDLWVPGLNSPVEELQPSYWRAP